MEVAVKKAMHELGNTVLTEWVAAQEDQYPAVQRGCAWGRQAQYVRRRPGMVPYKGECTTAGHITCVKPVGQGITHWMNGWGSNPAR